MKTIYTSDFKVGDEFTNELFLLQDVTRRSTKDGRPYLLCTIRDNSGQAGAVFWNVPDYIEQWAASGAAVLVSGRVVNYKDSIQINITDMNPGQQADLGELLPTSSRSRDDMIQELRQHITSLDEPWQTLTAHILLDDAFLPRYASAPAARSMHHAYISGLLEHSLSMAAIAITLAQHYPFVDRNLLLAGVLLHDMGKTYEYEVEGGFSVSDDGRLVGHIIRAIVLVEKTAAALNFPDDKLQHLIHLIASHHGAMEWGAPIVPKTLEAVLLHQIDLLDSRIQGFLDHVRTESGDKVWTSKSSHMFSTELRRPHNMP